MSLNDANPTFDAEELALLEQARRESEAEDQAALEAAQAEEANAAALAASRAPAPAPTAAPAAPTAAAPAAPAPAPAATPAAPAAPAAAPAPTAAAPATAEPAQGSLRAALRASRHAERQANERASALEAEVARLKASGATTSADGGKVVMSEADIAELRSYDPAAADKVVKLQRERDEAEQRAAQAAAAAAPAAQETFVPEVLPERFQTVIDNEVPELLKWQVDPNLQHLYAAAGDMNAYLLQNPKWAAASIADRFKEVVRRVSEDHGLTSATTPPVEDAAAKAKAIIDAAPVASRPAQIGGLRGGASPDLTLPDYSKMSDEDIMASLPVQP